MAHFLANANAAERWLSPEVHTGGTTGPSTSMNTNFSLRFTLTIFSGVLQSKREAEVLF